MKPPVSGVAPRSIVRAKPRAGWLLRPVGFVGALAAVLAALVLAINDDPVGLVVMLTAGLIGAAVFWWSLSRDRRWQSESSSAADAAEHRWLELLASSAGWTSGWSEVSASEQERTFIAQARSLSHAQLRRLAADAQFELKMPSRGAGLAGLAFRRTMEHNDVRLGWETRQAAIESARSAIERHELITKYRALRDEGELALGDAVRLGADGEMDHERADDLEIAAAAVEWASLALVTEAWLTDEQFAALYGPWSRAVVSGTDAFWYAPWSTLSLAGFWVTVAGIACAAVVNQGDAGYVSLGIIIVGVAGWATGAVRGATHSVPWPAPARKRDRSGGGRSDAPSGLRTIWRSPERILLKLTARTAASGRPKS